MICYLTLKKSKSHLLRKEKYELMYAPARVELSGMDWGALIKINRIGMSLAAAKSVLLMNFTNSRAGGD